MLTENDGEGDDGRLDSSAVKNPANATSQLWISEDCQMLAFQIKGSRRRIDRSRAPKIDLTGGTADRGTGACGDFVSSRG